MISENVFRLKKNGEPYSKCFCRHPEKIENYDSAIADSTQVWDCHHKFESLGFSRKQLVNMGMYYDVEPEELIFLTPTEHRFLHQKGKTFSEETKRKIGEAHSKKVLCIETGEIFESTYEAERKTGIYYCNISKVCNGKRKTAGGLHWKFYN